MARRDTDTRPVPSRPSIPGRGRRGGCRCAPPAPSASPFSCPARAGHPGSPLPTGSRRSAPRLRTRPVPNGARGTGRRIDEHDLRCHTCPPRTHIHGRPVRLERRSRGRRRCALPDGIDAPARKSTSATEAPRRRRRYRSTRSAISPGLRAPKITRSVPLTCPRSSTAHPDPIADTRHLTPTPAQSRTPLPRGAGRASYHGW
jgi:hypothetical protein